MIFCFSHEYAPIGEPFYKNFRSFTSLRDTSKLYQTVFCPKCGKTRQIVIPTRG